MPEMYRIAEVSVYALLNFLPLAILALYLFRRSLRLSFRRVMGVVAILCFLQVGIGIHVAFFPTRMVGIISLASTLLYGIAFLYVVKAPWGKSLYILLMLSNLGNYIVISSKCLEGVLFPQLARQQYRWSFSLTMLMVILLISGPMYVYVKKVIAPVILLEHDSLDWRFLWLLPAVFYFIWYESIYMFNPDSTLEAALKPRNTVVLTVINLGALLVYFVTARLLAVNEKNRQLEEQKSLQAIQTLQYEKLQEKIQETRRARHDLRHHINLLNAFVQNQDYQKLGTYLSEYTNSFSDSASLQLCGNAAVNLILLYFADLAKEQGVDFTVSARLSENIPVPETDLSVLFGNLLENALDACISDSSPHKRIEVRINETQTALYFTIDNTFKGRLNKSPANTFYSTKHEGEGIGIDSCRSIARRYHGTLEIEQDETMVYVSALLNFPAA